MDKYGHYFTEDMNESRLSLTYFSLIKPNMPDEERKELFQAFTEAKRRLYKHLDEYEHKTGLLVFC